MRAPALHLPAYRYVPGLQPHPHKGAGGHRHLADGGPPEDAAAPWWAGWRFAHGLDLLDHGYLWEAHEALEALWVADRQDAVRRALLGGLIQTAAASLCAHLERPEAAARLAARAAAQLSAAPQGVPGLGPPAISALIMLLQVGAPLPPLPPLMRST